MLKVIITQKNVYKVKCRATQCRATQTPTKAKIQSGAMEE
jgi:hypothetical protein